MKKLVAGIVVAVAASLAVAALAFGARTSTISVQAKLNAKQEVPAQVVKDTKAKGLFTGKIVGKKLTWKLTFSGLTGKATAAHIHMGAMGKAMAAGQITQSDLLGKDAFMRFYDAL